METAKEFLDTAFEAFARGEIDEAERLCDTVLGQVEHPYALHILGLVRHRQGRSLAGVELLERAQSIAGEYADNAFHRARMLLRLHEDDPSAVPDSLAQVERLFRRSIELDPGAPQPRNEFAAMLDRMGRRDEAIELLRPLLDRTPVPASVLVGYARLAPGLGETRIALTLLQDALAEGSFPHAEEADMAAALANLLDREGDYDGAFQAMSRSNGLRYATVRAPDFERHVGAIIEVFDSATASTRPRADSVSTMPIYIVGLPRSGTTLVEQILASHSQVSGGGELKNIVGLIDALPDLASGIDYPEAVSRLSPSAVDRMGREQLAYLTKLADGAERVTNKQPTNFIYLGLIDMVTPNAHVINCRRNLMDACVSMYFQAWDIPAYYIRTFPSLMQFCRGYERLMRHWQEILDLPILDIDYETLVNEPEATVARMLSFLDLPWEDACLRFFQGDRFVHTASYQEVRQPIYKRSIGRWRNYERHLGALRPLLET